VIIAERALDHPTKDFTGLRYFAANAESRLVLNAEEAEASRLSASSATMVPIAVADFVLWLEQAEAIMTRGSAGNLSMMNSLLSCTITSVLRVVIETC
jgi:hypothetical protein